MILRRRDAPSASYAPMIRRFGGIGVSNIPPQKIQSEIECSKNTTQQPEANPSEVLVTSHAQETLGSPRRTCPAGAAVLAVTDSAIGACSGGNGIDVDVPRFFFSVLDVVVVLPALLDHAPDVPPQRPLDAFDPFVLAGHDGGEGILRRLEGDVVALLELDAALAVKGAVGRGPRLVGHGDLEGQAVAQDHGPEAQSMWADGREEDGGDGWMDQ